MKKIKILTTGCGGDIGQSILKILRSSDMFLPTLGVDVHDKQPGKFLCDNFEVVPFVNDSKYVSTIVQLVKYYQIDVILPVAEPEIRYHQQNATFDVIKGLVPGLKVVLPNQEVLTMGFDKLATAEWLKRYKMPFLLTKKVEIDDVPDMPIIIKDRYGSGSKVLHLVEEMNDFIYLAGKHKNLIQQEFVPSYEGEFTCGLFRCDSICRSITFRRELTGGYSGYGVIENSSATTKFLRLLAEALNLNGSINVQFRYRDGVPYVFEINPRFSSTVLFRHLFGFKDLVWSIQSAVGIPVEGYNSMANGSAFYKGFEEYIVPVEE